MTILIGAISPHPPLLIPEIGRGEIKYVKKTDESLKTVSKKFNELDIDTVIFISPHAPFIRNAISIYSNEDLYGDFSQFGFPEVSFEFKNDLEIMNSLIDEGKKYSINFVKLSKDYYLDHGVLVPLYYLNQNNKRKFKIVAMSQHFTIDIEELPLVGEIIKKVGRKTDKKIGIIASGDMSHRLLDTGPYGFHPSGSKFDNLIINSIKNENFKDIISIPENILEEAGECGYRSIVTIFSAMPFEDYKTEILSHEGPFGVGYLVVLIERR